MNSEELYADSAQARQLDKRYDRPADVVPGSWSQREALERAESLRLAQVREKEGIAMRKRIASVCDDLAQRLGMQPYKEAP